MDSNHPQPIEGQEAFLEACASQAYPRLILSGVRLRVGWTVLAVALACELPQYLLLWSFYADDGWPIPARRETDGIALAAVYATVTALLAWLSRRCSHRKNELIPTAACFAICVATWAPLPGPDCSAGGGFVYAIASMVLAWGTLRTQDRSRRYPDEYFEPAAYEAFLQRQPRSGDRARYAFRGRSVAGARAAEVLSFGFAAAWLLGILIYAGWYYSRPKPDVEGFGEALARVQSLVEAGDRAGIAALANSKEDLRRRAFPLIPSNSSDLTISRYRHEHLRGLPRPSVSVDIFTASGSLDLRLHKNEDGEWRWSRFDFWPRRSR